MRRRHPTWRSGPRAPPATRSWSRPSAMSPPSSASSTRGSGPCWARTPNGSARPTPSRRRTCSPVVALRGGSCPEVVDDGVTGFVCDDLEELPWAIVKDDELEPKLCRQRVAEHFDVSNMVDGYEAVYRAVARTTLSHERWRIYAPPPGERMTS